MARFEGPATDSLHGPSNSRSRKFLLLLILFAGWNIVKETIYVNELKDHLSEYKYLSSYIRLGVKKAVKNKDKKIIA